MNRVISWLQSIRISQIIVVFLVGFMFLLGQAFSDVSIAQADVKTPEGTYYKIIPDELEGVRNDTETTHTQNPLKKAAEKIREKLNLDEKAPEATKEFFDPARKRTAEKEGYYQNSSNN